MGSRALTMTNMTKMRKIGFPSRYAMCGVYVGSGEGSLPPKEHGSSFTMQETNALHASLMGGPSMEVAVEKVTIAATM